MSEVFGRGGSLRASWYGDCLPTRDFPVLIDLYRKGRLDLDGFATKRVRDEQALAAAKADAVAAMTDMVDDEAFSHGALR